MYKWFLYVEWVCILALLEELFCKCIELNSTGWFIIETNSTCENFLKLDFMNYTLFKKKFLKVVILYFKPAVAHGIRD